LFYASTNQDAENWKMFDLRHGPCSR
jgi:hypothetical protein